MHKVFKMSAEIILKLKRKFFNYKKNPMCLMSQVLCASPENRGKSSLIIG